ncbi:hypothetical protein Nepgr_013495 [Nepenthes gracilis]|uniref:Uncharacterized protein n=1 Tax=Nepenthes gracilis TaxID=150966 RepID=A0AAD3XP72_NEPGR|nr:hypothetical protein Nepgr_013495 [Nepenthes gracilis]
MGVKHASPVMELRRGGVTFVKPNGYCSKAIPAVFAALYWRGLIPTLRQGLPWKARWQRLSGASGSWAVEGLLSSADYGMADVWSIGTLLAASRWGCADPGED